MAFRFTKHRGAPPDTAAPATNRGDRLDGDERPMVPRAALLAVPVLFALSGTGLYLALAPRIFTGATTVLIGTAANSRGAGDADEAAWSLQARRIASDGVARRAATAENLANDTEFAPKTPGFVARLLRLFGATRTSDQDGVAQASATLASLTTFKRLPGSPVVEIGVRSASPEKAARLSDAVAGAFVAILREQIVPSAPPAKSGDDLEAARQAYENADQALETYKHAHVPPTGGLPGDGDRNPEEVSTRLSEAAAHAADIKLRLDDIKRSKAAGAALEALPDSVTSPLLDKLRVQFDALSRQQATLRQTLGDRHPAMVQSEQQLRDLRKLITGELTRIQVGIEAEYRTAQADLTALQARAKAAKSTAIARGLDPRLQSLEHAVEVQQAAYDRELQTGKPDVPEPVETTAPRIIATSDVPASPSSPRVAVVLAIALALSAAAALATYLAAAIRVWPWPRRRRAGATTLSAATGDAGSDADGSAEQPTVPVLGSVPSPFGNPATLVTRDGLFDRLRTAWPTALDSEHVPSLPAFRTAVQALSLAVVGLKGDGPRTVLVTSREASDSRTTFALGVAESAAGQGLRTIVIDADEQGSVLRELVTASARPILIDLMGTSRVCYRILSSLRGSLSIVPIMPGESTIVRRLASHGAAAHIDGLAANFDLIIFDGPRSGGSTRLDAMAATVDAVVIVVPRTATQGGVDAAVNAAALPPATPVSVVLVADLAAGGTSSAAA